MKSKSPPKPGDHVSPALTIAPNRRRGGLLGWIVLCGPIGIILSVAIFRGSAWVQQQSEAGSISEAQTHNTLGVRALEEKRYEEAYSQFMFALKIKPDYGDAQVNLGNLFQAKGDYDRAISTFDRALSTAPKKRDLIYNNLGMAYAKKERYDEALAKFKSALESGFRLAPIYRNIGQLYQARKEYALAAEAYANAIAQSPTLDLAYREMLMDARLQLDTPDLIQLAESQLADGLSDVDRGRYDALLIEKYATRDPKLAQDYLSYAQALLKMGELEKGVEACLKAIELQPGNSTAHNRLGIILAMKGDFAKAEKEFSESVRLDPRNDEARENLERCQGKNQNSN